MEIRVGNQLIENGENRAIIEFGFPDFATSNYVMYLFQGNLSMFDIFMKFRRRNGHIRTPKHIHWVIDVLMKLQANRELTRQFLDDILIYWRNCEPLQNNGYPTIRDLVERMNFDVIRYSELSNYGEFPIDFLYTLMILLAVQEKTNRADAYLFGNILNGLLEDGDIDIFNIVSIAGFNGR